jgi:hypothetical protein
MWSEPAEDRFRWRVFVLVAFNFQFLVPTKNHSPNDVTNVKVKISLLQAVEAHRVAGGRGSHIS